MIEIGQTIYFKRPEDIRRLKGKIIGQSPDGWTVQGCRTATKSTPPVFILLSHEIITDHVPPKSRKKQREAGHGAGLTIIAAESLRRQQISTERLEMSESQVLQARAMLEIRRRTLRQLATSNRIAPSYDDYEFRELDSEFIVAQLAALRASAATATDDDIKQFKRHLAGEVDYSRIMFTITRSSKTAAIRYLKRRSQYHRIHTNIDDLAYCLTA